MAPALVELRDATKSYGRGSGEVVALAPATCSLQAGDRIALWGPSGSGKSTLLHLMAGLDLPSQGSIQWPALGDRESLRPGKIALVFQMPSLLPPLSVVENVEVPLLLAETETHAAREAALAALEAMDLMSIADKLPEEISGGQAQRVAIARALAVKPRVILADEPTGQLDHHTAQRVISALLASLGNTDTALVMSTHDPAVAECMQQVWCMDHGRLEVGQDAGLALA